MSAESEKAHVAHSALVLLAHLKPILLHIAYCFRQETNSPQNDTRNITAGPKVRLRKLSHIGTVQDGYRQRYGPNPQHLENPEAKKREKFVALAIEPIVFARLQDAEEEEAREAGGPDHDEEGVDDLASMVVAGEGEGYDGEDDEVGAAGEIWRRQSSISKRVAKGRLAMRTPLAETNR